MSTAIANDLTEEPETDVRALALYLGFQPDDLVADARYHGLTVWKHESTGEWKIASHHVRNYYCFPYGQLNHQQWTPASGGVYFIGCQGFIKIGKGGNVQKRLQDIQALNPLPVTLVAYVRTPTLLAASHLERSLHRKFEAFRHRGEWFRDCPEIGAYITTVTHR